MDLYYRLNVIQIKLPSLRVRRDDIPLLVDHFLKKLCDGDRQVNREAMEILIGYEWPGNVRELENVIERAIILGDGGTIGVDDLPDRVIRGDSPRGSMVIDTPELTLDELEKTYILRVLEHTGWHKKNASAILGINASTLYRKLQGYSLSDEFDRRKAA
jgi:DNA-binding NtrC family response regulator